MSLTEADLIRARILAAIRRYLDVLGGTGEPTLSDLAKALDSLVAVYHETSDVEPDTVDGPEPPKADENKVGAAAAAAFPELGWYALVDPERGLDQEIGLSIAIGDLTEIASDLLAVVWLFENASHNDALWDFRFGYKSHWGRHLHEVRSYIHALGEW